jgi:hypothetical protein
MAVMRNFELVTTLVSFGTRSLGSIIPLLLPNVVVEWLTLMLRILEVLCSHLGSETGYPDRGFCGFPQSLQQMLGFCLKLGQDHFFLRPFEFIIHLLTFHLTIHNLTY